MKLLSLLSAAALATASQAFAPNHKGAVSTQLRAEIGETGVAFENVAREWRCKVRLMGWDVDVDGAEVAAAGVVADAAVPYEMGVPE